LQTLSSADAVTLPYKLRPAVLDPLILKDRGIAVPNQGQWGAVIIAIQWDEEFCWFSPMEGDGLA
jgi:hypothetical protein